MSVTSPRHTVAELSQVAGSATHLPEEIEDLSLLCPDCDRPFLLTAAERLYYRERGYREPGHCPDCRASRRAERNGPLLAAHEAQTVEAEQAQETVYGATASHGRRGPRAIRYPAVCAACGKETEVPFLPRGDRPVYCRECFGQRKRR